MDAAQLVYFGKNETDHCQPDNIFTTSAATDGASDQNTANRALSLNTAGYI
jgi:hypothetical protein